MELNILILLIGFFIILHKLNKIEGKLDRFYTIMETYERKNTEQLPQNKSPNKKQSDISNTPLKQSQKEKITPSHIQSQLGPEKRRTEHRRPIFTKIIALFLSIKPKKKIDPYQLAMSIFLKAGVVSFIIGVGMFLKYSVDHGWIPIWMRATIGVLTGISIILAGIKTLNTKEKKVFSESLFGAGIAILYLSIFAAYAIPDFKFITFETAFLSMLSITFLAGLISIKFDSFTTAIFGIAGGFLTPFLINSGDENLLGLLSYYMVLNLGVLYISFFKKWSSLMWIGSVITSATVITAAYDKNVDLYKYAILTSLFFIIYTLAPFWFYIKNKSKIPGTGYLLFTINVLVVLAAIFTKNLAMYYRF